MLLESKINQNTVRRNVFKGAVCSFHTPSFYSLYTPTVALQGHAIVLTNPVETSRRSSLLLLESNYLPNSCQSC